MIIGSLGDILFEVSADEVKTIRDLSKEGSATIQKHARHLKSALTEFTGYDPETINFSIRLSKILGADPKSVLQQIESHLKKGDALQLIFGAEKFGEDKWLITKYKNTYELFDKSGNYISVDVKLTLTEYLTEL